MDKEIAQPIKTDEGVVCSLCYRQFTGEAAFVKHRRFNVCRVGSEAGLVGELSRRSGIIWSIS